MSKKAKYQSKISFNCPACGASNETRNMCPKCFQCGTALKITETNPRIEVEIRQKKKKK